MGRRMPSSRLEREQVGGNDEVGDGDVADIEAALGKVLRKIPQAHEARELLEARIAVAGEGLQGEAETLPHLFLIGREGRSDASVGGLGGSP